MFGFSSLRETPSLISGRGEVFLLRITELGLLLG